jgi:hypothetical protein
MPSVNWNVFEQLPGSAENNFEMLCRALIRRHYGGHGQFAALANQPGVEFHLKLHTACALGKPNRWFGWQCRWYGTLPSGTSLGQARRDKIEKSLSTTVKVLPDLTDWVLWTRHPLTAGDQKWFYGLKAKMHLKMRLDLWTKADVEDLLNGEAEIFRSTYFGDLILSPNALSTLHGTWVARVKKRWLPEAHQVVEAERTLRRMLGETQSWEQLVNVADRLLAATKSINADIDKLTGPLATTTKEFVEYVQLFATSLNEAHKLLGKGDLDLLRQQLEARVNMPTAKLTTALRKLRAARQRAALIATNTLADLRLGHKLLDEVNSFLGTRLVGVLADAGGGKTQLAAQLTAPSSDRPAGILIYGQDLHAGHDLDELARKVTLPGTGTPISNMEALVAALDAAGQRAHRRLPIIIDGLNEAEDPRNWKGPLASLNETLRRYPYVLVVCTLRTGTRLPTEQNEWQPAPEVCTRRTAFADEALPEGIQHLEMSEFGGDTTEAIRRYFQYYKINSGDVELPLLLSHPLTLRLFCEVTDPKREKEVGIEAMPGSLTAIFESYLGKAAERIAELAPLSRRYYELDVQRAFDEIGTSLWDRRARTVSERDLRKTLGDETRPWNESIVRALEQEGVILRLPGIAPGDIDVMAVYDAMGGHLAAKAILMRHGGNAFEQWLKNPTTLAALSEPPSGRFRPTVQPRTLEPSPIELSPAHPLATDIFRALVGLVPRHLNRQQLWPLLDEPLRTLALLRASRLEGAYLDNATVQALFMLASESSKLFPRLHQTRGAVAHPLNANFLDSVLRPMKVAQRDLIWTEWIRRNREIFLDRLHDLEQRWRRVPTTRTSSDQLTARWVMWMLTSTIRELRDKATRTLYWFGRGDSTTLFELTYESLAINDPYIPERMMAASYGVAMARHVDLTGKNFVKKILPVCAKRIYELIFKENAPHSNTHVLMREYARRILELASFHHRKNFSAVETARTMPPYKDGGLREWPESKTGKDEFYGQNSPFRMDFENYTLGRLVPGRGNYDSKNPEYRKIRAQVLWRVEQLGWSVELFKEIDQQIANDLRYPHGRSSDENKKTDRYGKKYSWIAYFEMAGLLRDQGKIGKDYEDDDRPSDIAIDPSFPLPLPKERLISGDFLGSPKLSLKDWIANGGVPNVSPYLKMSEVQNQPGPWIALDGFFTQEDARRGRRTFCFIRSFLVEQPDANSFFKHLSQQNLGGRWLPDNPRVIYTFAGEIPWCKIYPKYGFRKFHFVVAEKKVKIKRKRPACFLDGKQIQLTRFDLHRMANMPIMFSADEKTGLSPEEIERVELRNIIVEEEEIQRQTNSFKALIPVCDFGWEGKNFENESIHATVLAKEIANSLQLVGQPQTFDSFTKDGVRATFGVAERSNYNNSQSLFLIREDLLKGYLKNKKLSLVWAIWGEREYATDLINKWNDSKRPKIPYKVYQTIKQFKA